MGPRRLGGLWGWSLGKTMDFGYDYTGNGQSTNDTYGHTASRVMDENRNYAVPKSTTGGSLQTNLTWNTYNAPLTATGPNSDTTSFSYDAYARPNQRTEANGAITTLTYTTSPDVITQAPGLPLPAGGVPGRCFCGPPAPVFG